MGKPPRRGVRTHHDTARANNPAMTQPPTQPPAAHPHAGSYDVVVLGSGIAGLYTALQAHGRGASVLVVTKGTIDEANTRYAQGGIAAALGPDDSPDAHQRDTIEAGAGLVDEEAARVLVTEAADRIADLVRYGVNFDATDGEVALGREAAHSANRILHAGGDSTGLEMEITLANLARTEGITVIEHALGDALTFDTNGNVAGIAVFDWRERTHAIYEAPAVVLATGGMGQVYGVTTNPDVATGDGIALAYTCGAEVMDLEFTQFHPTALRLPGKPVFLVSEAVRGEGARLYNVLGERFMPRYHPDAELAPRDVVSRAEHRELRTTAADHVLLDITDRDEAWLAARFPQIYRTCLEGGFDMAHDRIPVSPAAHYTMGGVRTNTWGETTLPGLYAVGEVACTGVHGANRLASNSLLETVIFSKRAVQRIFERASVTAGAGAHAGNGALPRTADARALTPASNGGPPATADEVRALMWSHVGIERSGPELAQAAAQLARWQAALPRPPDRAGHDLRSMLTCARLAAEAALLREESRGAHYRTDFPEPRDEWRRHLVFRSNA